MIRMARVGAKYIDNLADPDTFVRAVHVTGDLENLGQGTAGRPALLRHRRRRADDPALRLVLRRQRAARQDRARPAAGRLRRLGVRASSWPSSSCCSASPTSRPADVPHLRRLPERVGQDEPRDDAGPGRARRPLPRRVLRRRHRLALGRPRGRQALRHQPRVRRLRRREGHQRGHQPDGAATRSPRHRRDLHQRRLQPDDPRGVVGGQDPRTARRRRRLAATGRATRSPTAASRARRAVGAPEQPVHHHAGQRAQHRPRLRGPARACRSTRSSSAAAPAIASR